MLPQGGPRPRWNTVIATGVIMQPSVPVTMQPILQDYYYLVIRHG